MKVVRFARGLPESACAGLINELKVLALLGEERENCSPFVLQPFMVDGLWAWRSTRGNLHIVTDVCGGGSLTAYRFRLSYPSLVLVIAEIVLGLHWLHEHGIVHHDVKPGNVMVSASGHCVLGDFGGAQFLDHRGKLSRNSDSCMVMTTQFAAPEILVRLDDGQVKEYDEAVDYWSLGATIVSMVLEEDYLPGASEPAFMEFRVDKIQTQLRRRNMPDDLEDLVMDLLRMDPARRCRYPAIMQQPIFYHTNWQDVENQAQAAIPALRDIAANAHGWEYPTPKIHKSNEATVDFLAALREQRLSLAVDDSYDVDRHNAKMTNCLSLGYPF
ncbi:kinase-like protein [Dichomitus squalens]|uniref:Kinase-like protein n=1 Tax=Dichomitus squalens TaxID=114155 RepID=A0A4Q9Q838_9APHY|nr:kinase-like protein [Dichomitus squalens]